MRLRLVERAFGIIFIQMAQEAHDEAGADAQFAQSRTAGAMKAVDDCLKSNAAAGMALGIEKHLDMAHIVRLRAQQIGPCQVEEILLGDQNRHSPVVDIEKVL